MPTSDESRVQLSLPTLRIKLRLQQGQVSSYVLRSGLQARLVETLLGYGTNPGIASLRVDQLSELAHSLLPRLL